MYGAGETGWAGTGEQHRTLHLNFALGGHLALQGVAHLPLELLQLLGADGCSRAAGGQQTGACAPFRVCLVNAQLAGRRLLPLLLAGLGSPGHDAVVRGLVWVLNRGHVLGFVLVL